MTAKIKLNAASGGGSVSLKAPSTTTSNAAVELQLPVADGSAGQYIKTDGSGNLAFATLPAGGIQQSDIWRSTTSHQGNVSALANWERPDSGNQGYIGSGMSNSSGTFSFPSTGIYQIQFFAHIYIHNTTSKSQRCTIDIRFTTNNSSYGTVASGHTNFGGGGYSSSLDTTSNATAACLFDVTDTANQKIQFQFGGGQGFEYIFGSSSSNQTYAIFTRHGDT